MMAKDTIKLSLWDAEAAAACASARGGEWRGDPTTAAAAAFVMESIHETNGTRDVNLATTPVLCLLRHAKMGNRTN